MHKLSCQPCLTSFCVVSIQDLPAPIMEDPWVLSPTATGTKDPILLGQKMLSGSCTWKPVHLMLVTDNYHIII